MRNSKRFPESNHVETTTEQMIERLGAIVPVVKKRAALTTSYSGKFWELNRHRWWPITSYRW
jgi:hypothetical protein